MVRLIVMLKRIKALLANIRSKDSQRSKSSVLIKKCHLLIMEVREYPKILSQVPYKLSPQRSQKEQVLLKLKKKVKRAQEVANPQVDLALTKLSFLIAPTSIHSLWALKISGWLNSTLHGADTAKLSSHIGRLQPEN